LAGSAGGVNPLRTDVEAFVGDFAEGWRRPKPDGFLEYFAGRCSPGVRMVQPLAPTTTGLAGFEALFRDVFDLFPDYEVRVEDWAVRGNVAYLWVEHSATIGRRRASWAGVDRVVLSPEGLIEERVALFDPTAVLPALLRAPGTWRRFLRLTLAGRLRR
jgi:hypothetical protein